MIDTLQQELVEIAALKSGVVWREKGEKSPKYLKTIHHQRTAQQFIPGLREPTSTNTELHNNTDSSASTIRVDSHSMNNITQNFYNQLYTKDEVEDNHIQDYLDEITFTNMLSKEDQEILTEPISVEELQSQASRLSANSSPGSDGLGYPYLSLLFNLEILEPLILQLYQDAINGVFPSSWQDIRVRLLPKKGDLSLLKNWRPISLINCDAKIFTRILAQRLGKMMNNILNDYQTGFIPGRFIGDNGFALSMILDESRRLDYSGVGILLDQEKAYDRVHPLYLRHVLERFHFPSTIITCILNLFFENQVYVNVNGFFTAPITQQRGLRQGDPLSPLLFNLALEPFLLHLLQEDGLSGYQSPAVPSVNPTPTIKCLAYADDICVFLDNPEELGLLHYHMQRYSDVSNAKFNEDKSEAIFLNGKLDEDWTTALHSNNISNYYHDGSASILRYLGFRFPFNSHQRGALEDTLISTIHQQCAIYSQRQLSIQGRVTVVNILILSKLWYCLRLFQPTKKFFQRLGSAIYQFVWQKKSPRLKKTLLFMPVEYGGLKVLNPIIQHKLLQKRWLNYLLDPIDYPSFVYPIMVNHLSQFKNSQDFPLLPFYNKECRVSPVSPRHLSIWPVIFEMFDYFNDDGKIQMNQVPVTTLLAMPLRHLLTYPSSQESEYTHWTLKHANYAANLFLTFDISQQRLRLKVQGEYSRFPRLCQSLYNEILVSRNIKLKPFVWSHIVAPPVTNATTIEEWKMHHLVTTMKSNHRWYQFCPQTLRNRYQITGESMILFGAADIKEFWRTIMYPQARTIFFRTFSKCIPSKDLLFKFTIVSSPICSFCGSTEDSFKHFLVLCAPKQVIWYQVLSHYYPHLYFSPEDLILTLTSLKKPYWVRYCSKYIPIISTILWQQWNLYWSHGTENINPISTIDINKSIPRIVSLIERLLHPISSD